MMLLRPRSLRVFLAGVAVVFGSIAAAPAIAQEPAVAAPTQDALIQALRQQEPRLWQSPDLLSEVLRGFEIAPVPLNLAGKNLALVGLGSYVVNAQSGCSDCHTNPAWAAGGNPFMGQDKQVNAAGYLGGGQQFGPGIVSRNLTPEDGLPAGRTYAQFVQIMRTGIDLDHLTPQYGPLLQVMPWPAFQSMTDTDLRAIYTYLEAIPPVRAPN